MGIRVTIWWVALGVLGSGIGMRPVAAQTLRTSERVTDLERRMEQLLQLQEAFLPTIERMESRLESLEKGIAALPTTPHSYDARKDVAELQRRLDALESYYQNALRRQSLGLNESAWLKSEYDIVASRLNGTEQRYRTLAMGRANDRGSSASSAAYRAPSARTSAGYAPYRANPTDTRSPPPNAAIQEINGDANPGLEVLRGLTQAGLIGGAPKAHTTIVIQVFVHGDSGVENYREVR